MVICDIDGKGYNSSADFPDYGSIEAMSAGTGSRTLLLNAADVSLLPTNAEVGAGSAAIIVATDGTKSAKFFSLKTLAWK